MNASNKGAIIMAKGVSAVRAMFGRFERRGSMRTAYLSSTPDAAIPYNPKAARYGNGYVDYHGPLSIKNPVKGRMISGVAKKGSTDYIIRILLYQKKSMPVPTLSFDAVIFKRPINDYQMHVHDRQSTIGHESFDVPVGNKKPVSDYLKRMSPEEVFLFVAKRNEAFLRLIERFNKSVGR